MYCTDEMTYFAATPTTSYTLQIKTYSTKEEMIWLASLQAGEEKWWSWFIDQYRVYSPLPLSHDSYFTHQAPIHPAMIHPSTEKYIVLYAQRTPDSSTRSSMALSMTKWGPMNPAPKSNWTRSEEIRFSSPLWFLLLFTPLIHSQPASMEFCRLQGDGKWGSHKLIKPRIYVAVDSGSLIRIHTCRFSSVSHACAYPAWRLLSENKRDVIIK